MPEASELDRELRILEADLRQLEAEYNMYFAGRLPRPPVETRARVTALVKRLDRMHVSNYAVHTRLDAKPEFSCAGRVTLKVKPGKHSFSVSATDAAGLIVAARMRWL